MLQRSFAGFAASPSTCATTLRMTAYASVARMDAGPDDPELDLVNVARPSDFEQSWSVLVRQCRFDSPVGHQPDQRYDGGEGDCQNRRNEGGRHRHHIGGK